MRAHVKPPIVVGVDGSEQGLHAVQFAVDEARRSGCGVRLVHALPEVAATSPVVPIAAYEIFDDVAQQVMQQAEETARATSGDHIRLEKVVRTGTRVHVLVEESDGARLVVLGHRDRSLRERVLTASTSTGVASRAHCPAVCVPSSWSGSDAHARVVVGIEDPEHAHELLSRAFAAASERGARLRVLYAWRLQRPYDDIMVGESEASDWTSQVTGQLEAATADLRSAFPEVEVEIDVRHQDPASALVAASDEADLLLLGRRRHTAPLGLLLGGTARALIRESHCPVEITALPRRRRDADETRTRRRGRADTAALSTRPMATGRWALRRARCRCQV